MLNINPVPKFITYRDRAYLDWIKGQPCLVCGKPSEPCHVRRHYWGAGTSKKPHDYCAIQLCRDHHSYATERQYGTDRQVAENLMRYIQERT